MPHHGTGYPYTHKTKSMAYVHSPAILTAFTHLCDAPQILLQMGELGHPKNNCLTPVMQ